MEFRKIGTDAEKHSLFVKLIPSYEGKFGGPKPHNMESKIRTPPTHPDPLPVFQSLF